MSIESLLEREFGLIAELIARHAATTPTHAALVDDRRRLDYAALDRLMDSVAAALRRDGLGPGDVVAICAANAVETAAIFLGAVRAGLAVAPLAPSATPDSLAMMLGDCRARMLFLDDLGAQAMGGDLGPKTIALADGVGGVRLADWLAAPDGAVVDVAPQSPFNIIYSSGTTGAAKGIVQSHAMRWAHVKRGASTGYGPDASTLISTPLYSNTTLISFLPTLALGGTVRLMGKFSPRRFLELSAAHRITHAMLVPVQYRRIMEVADFEAFDLSAFRMKYCTSAPFPAALKRDILARWPGGLVEHYGMTEGGGACILFAHEHPDKLHTVGRPAPGHDIRLIDDDGREVARGEAGEVVGRSMAMMNGYLGQPAKTADAEWRDEAGRRFIRTGDVGRFDEDGFLQLVDRKKDMIISGGFNIYPSDLEAAIAAHPEVLEAAVVGVESELWGETPVGFVVRQPGAEVSDRALRAWVNARVAKTQRLHDLIVVEALPRSEIGKVLKRVLKDGYRPQAGPATPSDASA